MTTPAEGGAPRRISYYRLGRVLGRGGMGTVYEATDTRNDITVALKLLHEHLESDESFRERFQREAHVAALLRSPYTVHLLDYGIEDNRYFLVMKFAEGESLRERLEGGPLEPATAFAIAAQIARALEEAEARGVIHRDIKPDNVMLGPDGSAQVLDFGIARQTGAATLTAAGAFIGTLTYAAPEAAEGNADHRSDLYSLGVTLYHMLVGQPPFAGEMMTVLLQHREAKVPREPLTVLPSEAGRAVLRCLEKDPADRYQSASELAGVFEHLAVQSEGLDAAADAGATEVLGVSRTVASSALAIADAAGRRRLAIAAAAAAALVAVVVGAVLVFGGGSGDGGEAEPSLPAAASATDGTATATVTPTATPAAAATQPAAVAAPATATPASTATPAATPTAAPTSTPTAAAAASTPVPTAPAAVAVAKVQVPDLLGATVESAGQQLEALGLEPVTIELPTTDVPKGQVFSQSPGAGTEVDSGAQVTLNVSTGPPDVDSVRITGIEIVGGSYSIEFETTGYTPAVGQRHIHFFFDTVPPSNSGAPGSGPWIVYGGSSPFTGQTVASRPAAADRMCVIVANANHTVEVDSASCFALP